MAEVWTFRGMAAAGSNDFDTARASYEKAISIYAARPERDAQHANDLCQEIVLLALLGRLPEAKELLQESLVKYPEDGQLHALKDGLEDVASGLSPFALHPD